MRLKRNTAEGAGIGTQIVNATVASLTGGDSGDAFNAGSINTNGQLFAVFENMQGSIAYKSVSNPTGANAVSQMWWSGLNLPTLYASGLFKIMDAPGAGCSIMEGRTSADVRCGGIGVTTARKITLFDAGGVNTGIRYTSTLAVNLGEIFRADLRVVGVSGTSGKLQARIWREADLVNATPTELLGADTALWNTTGTIDIARFGINTALLSTDIRWDDAQVWNVWPAVPTGPTALGFSNAYIGLTTPVDAPAGTLTTTGGNGGNVYSFVSGNGSDDNAQFTIVGDVLRAATAFTIGPKKVRVRVTDAAGALLEEQFTIHVVGGSRIYQGTTEDSMGDTILKRVFPRVGNTPLYRRVPIPARHVVMPFLSNPAVLYAPSVSGLTTVVMPFLNAAPTFYPPTVTREIEVVFVPFLNAAPTFYNPTVTRETEVVGLRAFPTAEGFGALATGGRGSGANDADRMTIYKVTRVDTSPGGADPAGRAASFDGTLRWAVEATGPRIIVFGVAGDITITRSLFIDNPYCTILGHVAPGHGVQLRAASSVTGVPFLINASHCIVRYLRSRMFINPATGNPGASHASIAISNTIGKVVEDVIVDHCSAEAAYDVNLQILAGRFSRVTVQWCISAEGYQNGHQRMLSIYVGETPDWQLPGNGDVGYVTFHHNLLSRGQYRSPHIGLMYGRTEVINQVGYFHTDWAMNLNVGAHGSPFKPGKMRIIGSIWTKCANPPITNANTGVTGPRNTVSDLKDLGTDPNYRVYIHDTIGPGRTTDAQPDIDSIADPETFHFTSDPLCTTAASDGFPTGRFELPAVPVVATSPWQAWHDVLGATTVAPKVIVGGGGSISIPAGAPRAGTRPAGASLPVIDAWDQRILNYTKDDTLGNLSGNTLFREALTAPTGISPAVWPVMATTPAQAADGGTTAWAPSDGAGGGGDAIPTTWKTANIPGGSFPWSYAPDGYTYAEHYYYSLTGEL